MCFSTYGPHRKLSHKAWYPPRPGARPKPRRVASHVEKPPPSTQSHQLAKRELSPVKMGTFLWFPSSGAGGARLLGGFHGACCCVRPGSRTQTEAARGVEASGNVGTGWPVHIQVFAQVGARVCLREMCGFSRQHHCVQQRSAGGVCPPQHCHSPASSCAPRRSSQSRRSTGVFSPHLSHRLDSLASVSGLPSGTSTRCRGSARSRPAATKIIQLRALCFATSVRAAS